MCNKLTEQRKWVLIRKESKPSLELSGSLVKALQGLFIQAFAWIFKALVIRLSQLSGVGGHLSHGNRLVRVFFLHRPFLK